MTINAGIIGTGFGRLVHLPGLQYHSKFEVKIIAGRNLEKTKKIGTEANIDWTTNWEEVVNREDIELIAVVTPPYHHFQMANLALKKKKHLLLEKPTTTNALQAKKLVTLAQDRGLMGMMSHALRFLPNNRLLSKAVGEGKIGNIKEVHYYDLLPYAGPKDIFSWEYDTAFDGGWLGIAGSHLVDMIRATTGLEIVEVQGQLSTKIKTRKDRQGKTRTVSADDGFAALFQLENGAPGVLDHSPTLVPAPPARVIIAGDEGTLLAEGKNALIPETVNYATLGDEFQEMKPDKTDALEPSEKFSDWRIPSFLKLLDQLYDSIEHKTMNSPNLVDGWRNQ
ncbi:MAG: Gfo/Idh/MocA family protein, partial [Candidatus Heimdallarchaeota archaeon]